MTRLAEHRFPSGCETLPFSGRALLGVPYDFGNGVAPGAREGPAYLRAHLARATGRAPGAVIPGLEDLGDLRLDSCSSPAKAFDRLRTAVSETAARGVVPLMLGGDHSLSYFPIAALQETEKLAVLWLDAHTDFSPWDGAGSHDHRQVLRRIARLPGVCRAVVVGYRGFTVENEMNLLGPVRVMRPGDLREVGAEGVVRELPTNMPCYISIDIDVVDPSIAPGTSTPVPGGLLTGEVVDLLVAVQGSRRICGADLVEVNPQQDRTDGTGAVAASILLGIVDPPIPGSSRVRADG